MNNEGVNTIFEIKSQNGPALPFFATGGADSLIKIFEHNLYSVENIAEGVKISTDDIEKIKNESSLEKKQQILRGILGKDKADKLIAENFDFSNEALEKLKY
jgi:hypothetical protein